MELTDVENDEKRVLNQIFVVKTWLSYSSILFIMV